MTSENQFLPIFKKGTKKLECKLKGCKWRALPAHYSKLLKESDVDIVDIEEGVANLQELNEASKLFSSTDTSETVNIWL